MPGTRVTAVDVDDPAAVGEVVITNDYVVIVDGTCVVDGVVAHSNGTHVVTIKGRSS